MKRFCRINKNEIVISINRLYMIIDKDSIRVKSPHLTISNITSTFFRFSNTNAPIDNNLETLGIKKNWTNIHMHSNSSNYLGINNVFTIHYRHTHVNSKTFIGGLYSYNMKVSICTISNNIVTQKSWITVSKLYHYVYFQTEN